eukprot:7391315-Prymnesium_polylepis.1
MPGAWSVTRTHGKVYAMRSRHILEVSVVVVVRGGDVKMGVTAIWNTLYSYYTGRGISFSPKQSAHRSSPPARLARATGDRNRGRHAHRVTDLGGQCA